MPFDCSNIVYIIMLSHTPGFQVEFQTSHITVGVAIRHEYFILLHVVRTVLKLKRRCVTSPIIQSLLLFDKFLKVRLIIKQTDGEQQERDGQNTSWLKVNEQQLMQNKNSLFQTKDCHKIYELHGASHSTATKWTEMRPCREAVADF